MVSILCTFLTGCSNGAKDLKESDLYGKYKITLDYGTETIELKSDRTFVQTYVPYNGKTVVLRGRWRTLEQGTSQFQVEFRNILELDQFHAPSPLRVPKELYSLWPYGSREETHLTNSPDYDKVYDKIK